MARQRVLYWEKWGGRERGAMEDVTRAFNRSQTRYEVVMEDAGDWSSSPDLPRFLAAQAGGSPPDVIGLEDHQVVDLATAGAIVPLPATAVDPEELAAFRSEFLSLGIHAGTPFALPVSVDLVTYYVNQGAVRGTALEGGRLPPRLLDFRRAVDEYERGGRVALVPSYPGWWPHAWAVFFGGSWVDTCGSFTPLAPGNLEAMEWIRSVRDGLAPAGRDPQAGGVANLLAKALNPVGRTDPDPFFTEMWLSSWKGTGSPDGWPRIRSLTGFPPQSRAPTGSPPP